MEQREFPENAKEAARHFGLNLQHVTEEWYGKVEEMIKAANLKPGDKIIIVGMGDAGKSDLSMYLHNLKEEGVLVVRENDLPESERPKPMILKNIPIVEAQVFYDKPKKYEQPGGPMGAITKRRKW